MQLAEVVYEPTTVHTTLGRGAYPLHFPYLKSHKVTSQLPTFNPTRFPILTTVGYLVRGQCNSRACFISEMQCQDLS